DQRPERVPLSLTHPRLWFLDRLLGPGPTYNIPLALRLHGKLDEPALRAALSDVVRRHESLRTIFPDIDGEPYQLITEADPELAVVEVTGQRLEASLVEAARGGFDLAAQPPLRATLFRAGP